MTRHCIYIMALVSCSLVCLPSRALSAEVTSIAIIEAGLFQAKKVSSEIHSDVATGELSTVDKQSVRLVKATDEIHAELGVRFGIRYVVNGAPAGAEVPIEIKWRHPATYNPETGRSTNTTSWTTIKRIGETAYAGHSYEKDGDMPLGKYTIQLFHAGTKLAEKEFLVVESR